MNWCARAFFHTPSELRENRNPKKPTENKRKHWRNEGPPEHRKERTLGNETRADATVPSARKTSCKQTQAQNATQATQQTPPAQPATHATQRHATSRPSPLPSPHPRPTRRGGNELSVKAIHPGQLRPRSGPPLLQSALDLFRWHSALLFRVVRDTPCFTLDRHSALFTRSLSHGTRTGSTCHVDHALGQHSVLVEPVGPHFRSARC